MYTERKLFKAPYESPRSEIVALKPYGQFLQGSLEDIEDGGEIGWDIQDSVGEESLWERLGLGI